MAVSDYILEIKEIPGETHDKVFKAKNGIDILSFSWGVSNSGSAATAGGSGSGKASFQDLNLTMGVNKASPLVGLGCAVGTHYPSAILHVRKQGEGQQEFYTITLTDVLITSYQGGGSAMGGDVTDNFSLSYAKIKFEYKPQDGKGGVGSAITLNYDVKGNTKV